MEDKKQRGGRRSEVQLIPWGRHRTERGSFLLDAESIEAVMSDYRWRSSEPVIDYEHQSLTGEEAPAAGWIKRLVDRGLLGLWAEVLWTERARELIANGEYRFLSPVFLKRPGDERVVRLLGAGLTNLPAIDGMAPLEAEGGRAEKGKEEEEVKKEILELLGLPEGTAGEEAEREIALALKRPAAPKLLELLGLGAEATAEEAEGAIGELKERAEAFGERLSELQEKMKSRTTGRLVAHAMREGKITPAQRDWAEAYAAKDPEGFRLFAESAEVVVPVGLMAEGGLEPGLHAAASEESELQRMVNRALGIDEEAWRRQREKEEGKETR